MNRRLLRCFEDDDDGDEREMVTCVLVHGSICSTVNEAQTDLTSVARVILHDSVSKIYALPQAKKRVWIWPDAYFFFFFLRHGRPLLLFFFF